MKGVLKECNTTAYKKIKKVNETRTHKTTIKLDNRQVTAMIDNNATTNFISRQLIKTLNLFTQIKKKSYKLIVINENNLKSKNKKQIIKKTRFLLIIIQRYHEKIIFNIANIISYNIVLKLF